MSIAKQFSTLLVIFSTCYLFCLAQAKADPLHDCPQVMFWAWERPENLKWINPRKVGIAYLDRTISLRDESLSVHPRQQSLAVPPGTYTIAVVRLESNAAHLPKFSASQVDSTVQAILQAVKGNSKIGAIQIDFDARESERAAYRDILEKLRASMPSHLGLSMTALASWCAGDCWLKGLPVDEVVPMYFSMGVAEQNRSEYLEYLRPLSSKRDRHHIWCKCQGSVGVATDEYIDPALTQNRRVYVFSPKPWVSQQKISAVNYTRYE